ncbi:sugar ABC transporter substrate-binding protein [Candidatus Sumerlaeota bacterium]|nr:sugar ABC transporter substrate-binding protein [Candidatus Sumerlaeota bacterium]
MSEERTIENSAPDAAHPTRRDVLKHALAGIGAAGAMTLLACQDQKSDSAPKGEKGRAASGPKPLRAAIGNGGLQSTWCALGKTTTELWGKLLNVEVTWFDGGFNSEKQRSEIERIADQDWDFVAVQSFQIDTLEPAVRKLKKRNTPVISMDTNLVAPERMREVGVWVQVEPDQQFMGRSSTQYLMEKIGGKGKVIHIGGHSGHSGAQGRAAGFVEVAAKYPGIEVVGGGVRWCDWEKEKARSTFEALLNQTQEKIAGAFFHSDDMALAAIEALKGTKHEGMIVTAVDGQREGLTAIKDGRLAATTVNPVCLIHQWAMAIGQFIVRNGEKVEGLPQRIVTPGPLVSRESGNIDAQFYLADPKHCLV